jgi:hypothetical protein
VGTLIYTYPTNTLAYYTEPSSPQNDSRNKIKNCCFFVTICCTLSNLKHWGAFNFKNKNFGPKNAMTIGLKSISLITIGKKSILQIDSWSKIPVSSDNWPKVLLPITIALKSIFNMTVGQKSTCQMKISLKAIDISNDNWQM